LKYASSIVNVVADARVEHGPGLGSFAYDDEGVPAQCIDIIKDGQFRGYLSSRETAHLIGLQRSGGTVRTEGWNRLPMIRMTNVSLLPGAWNFKIWSRIPTMEFLWRPTAPGPSTTIAFSFSSLPKLRGKSRMAKKAVC
jgi:hypothetical protein